MSNVHIDLDPEDFLDMRFTGNFTRRDEAQVVCVDRSGIRVIAYLTAADARAIALAFQSLAAQIDEAASARAVPEGVTVLDITGDIEQQLHQAGVS